MRVTEVKIFLADEGKLKAYALITFDNCFVVRDVRVIEYQGKLMVAMPNKRTKYEWYKDIAHPITAEFRRHIETHVFSAYTATLGKTVCDTDTLK